MPKTSARRTRAPKRNSGHKSMTWGTLPEYPAFEKYVMAARDEDNEPVIGPSGDVFHMELVGRDKESAKLALKTLFATGTPVAFERFAGRHGKFGIRFQDLVSLHKFILALLTISELETEGDSDDREEGPGDLASSIMSTLTYEWI
jgi:hypothetical protein